MLGTISCFVFGTMFFGMLSAHGLWKTTTDPVRSRLRFLHPDGPEPPPALLLGAGTSQESRKLAGQLGRLGLHRRADVHSALKLQRLCLLAPVVAAVALFFMGFPMLPIVLVTTLVAVFGLIAF